MTEDGPKKAVAAAAGLALLAGLYRAVLVFHYYGSEEEDYGNLGIILGTLQSKFTYIETEHMPFFTSLAALATAFTGDSHSGGEAVAILGGAATVFLTVLIGWRWLSPAAGVIAGVLVLFQPDAALTAATPLRISTYVALCLGGVYALGERRSILGGLLLAAAFLTRFDLAFTLLPAAALLLVHRKDRRLAAAVGIVAAVVVAWAIYYRVTLGTFAFWGSVADRSTGEQGGGVGTALQFLWFIVGGHAGYVVVAAAGAGVWLVVRGAAGRPDDRPRWLALCFGATFGFLLLAVFLSAYRYDHNLFWKWMCSSVPFLALFAGHAAVELLRDRARSLAIAAAVLGLGATGAQYVVQTSAQLDRSDTWYGTQVRLMDWVEEAYPKDVTLVADLIFATYLARKPTERRVLRWSTDNTPEGLDREAFGRWLRDERVAVVITFREGWVGSARKAPWLTDLAPLRAGPVRLTPLAMEPGYGWVAWRAEAPGAIPAPRTDPPVDAGAVRVVYE